MLESTKLRLWLVFGLTMAILAFSYYGMVVISNIRENRAEAKRQLRLSMQEAVQRGMEIEQKAIGTSVKHKPIPPPVP